MSAKSEFYRDIFSTAIEGGINYWAYTYEYKWEDLSDFHAVVGDMEEASMRLRVDESTIGRGFGLLMADESLARNRSQLVLSYLTYGDDGDFDADDADIIVQLGLFGSIVYG